MNSYDHEILLLQGGGALGAYQAGVYTGLADAGITPTWVVGISIGGINAALIAGNPPERRVERLREFWMRVSQGLHLTAPAWLDSPWPTLMSASWVAMFGVQCFFVPRTLPPWWLAPLGAEAAQSYYDTKPLRDTLMELVDFDLINRGEVRLSLGAVNVRKGVSVYFDSRDTNIHADHVRASGALPPGFPPVMIDGDYYWDGGVVTNTPISYVFDERPLTTARIIQVDNFKAEGLVPANIGKVTERTKDIQYASRTRVSIDRIKELAQLQAAARRLITKLPAELKADPDAQTIADMTDDRRWTVIRIINERPARCGEVKDYEFSRPTVQSAWNAGVEDVARSIAGWDRLTPSEAGPGIVFYRPTEAQQTSPGKMDRRTRLLTKATKV